MRLPHKIEIGNVPVTFCSAYNPDKNLQFKTAIEDGAVCYADIEWPQPEFLVQNSLELHLGVSGQFKNVKLYSAKVRPHIDIYIPIEAVIGLLLDHAGEMFEFYAACKNLNLNKAEIGFLALKKLRG